jgi:hypothetical protein
MISLNFPIPGGELQCNIEGDGGISPLPAYYLNIFAFFNNEKNPRLLFSKSSSTDSYSPLRKVVSFFRTLFCVLEDVMLV